MSSPPAPSKKQQKQINLLRGWPSPDLLPAHLLSSAAQRILSSPVTSVPLLQYAPDEGYQPLRERLAQWLGRHYGVEPDANRICVTGGASQNLACILQSFTDPKYTRAVWMVAPCYHLAGAIFEDAGFRGRLRAVPEDEEGVDLGQLERRMEEWEKEEEEEKGFRPEPFKDPGPFRKLYRHIIYAVPTCSNPSGKTMSLHHRQALVRLARKHDALVISDDVYDFLQWPLSSSSSSSSGGRPLTPERPPEMRLPRLCDVDRAMGRADNDPRGFGHAVSNGSFSKIAGPGVRTGWAEGSAAFALGLSKTGSSMSGGAPSGLCAGIMADLLETGELVEFIEERTRPALQRRHRIMMEAVREYLGPLGVVARESSVKGVEGGGGVYGGYFVWLTLTRGPLAVMVSDAALKEENIIVGRGDMFAVKGDEAAARFDENIRLCFSWEPEEDLVDGVKRLGELIRRMQGNLEHYERLAAAVKDSDRPVSSWV
ncbi:Aspartate/tyrosine/aromatic aminotransferase [Trichoderma citrinoviride]|uniref:Aspartate/tyrosine/aromatic aminotransferase n=1 Tax=Trichoderma citrinoviride TaxID=58853 RepID=A0A2T4BNY3_9HYPO|nr:Aspartate/tyrosine/aromatic aminotransferase [Trichoderma citrinoviride]PTB71000.1 Aspartate/tyrosine/aromatic aminotransferase [Trichoderma citrinoviride]